MTAVDVWSVDLARHPALDPRRLSTAERERAARLRRPRDRVRWLAARAGLRLVLARYLGQDPARIELRLGEHGKPALAGREPPLRFNLSHSGDLALIAVSRELEVGVDLEQRQDGRDFLRLAELGLGEGDAAAVRNASPDRRAATFYAAWVRREAVAKCLGTGLGRPLPDTTTVSIRTLDAGPRHAAALAVAATQAPTVRLRVLAPA